jgi:hypothetical protein
MPANTVTINGHMEFIVPDSKIQAVEAILWAVSEGASNKAPDVKK